MLSFETITQLLKDRNLKHINGETHVGQHLLRSIRLGKTSNYDVHRRLSDYFEKQAQLMISDTKIEKR